MRVRIQARRLDQIRGMHMYPEQQAQEYLRRYRRKESQPTLHRTSVSQKVHVSGNETTTAHPNVLLILWPHPRAPLKDVPRGAAPISPRLYPPPRLEHEERKPEGAARPRTV